MTDFSFLRSDALRTLECEIGEVIWIDEAVNFGAAKPSPEELVAIARSWLERNWQDLSEFIYNNHEDIEEKLKSPAATLVTVLADLLLAWQVHSPIPTARLAQLLCLVGISKLRRRDDDDQG